MTVGDRLSTVFVNRMSNVLACARVPVYGHVTISKFGDLRQLFDVRIRFGAQLALLLMNDEGQVRLSIPIPSQFAIDDASIR